MESITTSSDDVLVMVDGSNDHPAAQISPSEIPPGLENVCRTISGTAVLIVNREFVWICTSKNLSLDTTEYSRPERWYINQSGRVYVTVHTNSSRSIFFNEVGQQRQRPGPVMII